MNRGFLILAHNSDEVDYVRCAEVLAHSIKNVMPTERVALLTNTPLNSKYFDYIVTYPYGDTTGGGSSKLANDWQIYDATPFDYTIKLEADMYIPARIDHWWPILMNRDVVISTGARSYTGEFSRSRYYRKIFDKNDLPDLYNAITYYRRGTPAAHFFNTVKEIFTNWSLYNNLLKCQDPGQATTDVVYAIAALLHGVENCTMPWFKAMSMCHMKKEIIGTKIHDWTKELIYEVDSSSLRIGTIPQLWPVHYYVKEFADILAKELGIDR